MQEIYFFICQNISNQNKGEKMTTNKINKYLFALGSFVIVIYLASNTSNQHNEIVTNSDNSIDTNINQIDDSDFSTNLKELNNSTEYLSDKLYEETNSDENESFESKIKKTIPIINSIKIAEQIDIDEKSETYRDPINSYKTITTLDKNVIKDINYYPEFYIWTSINTELVDLKTTKEVNYEQIVYEFNPTNLSITVSCNNQIIANKDFQINAKTPRWREWIKIDLDPFESESILGQWNVKIVNIENKEVLEFRSFNFNKEFNHDEIKQTAQVLD